MSSDGFGVRLTQRGRTGDRNPSLRIIGKEGVASDRQEPRITSRVNPEQEYLEDRWTEIGGNDHPEQTPEAFTRDPMVPSLAFQFPESNAARFPLRNYFAFVSWRIAARRTSSKRAAATQLD